MKNKKLKLSDTDLKAVEYRDGAFLNAKGADLYQKGDAAGGLEYYRLAACFEDRDALNNLGNCYLYGRNLPQNTDLALVYLELASTRGSIHATSSLGGVFGSDHWGRYDLERSDYYYLRAADMIMHGDWDVDDVMYNESLLEYPELCFALGRQFGKDGSMGEDFELSFMFLMAAEVGFGLHIGEGDPAYEEAREAVLDYMERPEYADYLAEYEGDFDRNYN